MYSPLQYSNQIELESGLFIENKGFSIDHKKTIDEGSYSSYYRRPTYPEGDINVNILYLTIPATMKVYFNSFYLNTGIYISNALNAKSKIARGELKDFYEENEAETEHEIKIGYVYEDKEIITPFDFGLIVGAGYTFESISIDLSYDYGIYDVNTSTDEDSILKNRVVKVSLSYKI